VYGQEDTQNLVKVSEATKYIVLEIIGVNLKMMCDERKGYKSF
jgi:hypothetical protein